MASGLRRTSEQIKQKSTEIRDDLREGTDASLLAVLRLFGLIYGPIDRKARIDVALKQSLARRLPAHVGWRNALGGITYLLLMILVVTGVLLAFYYRPSAQEAYPSVQHIVSEIPFGWLIRDLHVWSASLIVVLSLVHMARVFMAAAHKPPRETNWVIGLGLLMVVLAFGATGYLLPWDQWAYWTVVEALDNLGQVPLVGGLAQELFQGDVTVSGATLSRFFSLHVIVLPWVLFGLVGLHFQLIRKQGLAPPITPTTKTEGIPFYPNHLIRMLMVTVLTVAVLTSLAAFFPRPVAEAADPAVVPDALVSTWVVVDIYRGTVHYLGRFGLPLMGVLGLALALLPLFDRDPEFSSKRHPAVAALGYAFFLGLALAWVGGRALGDAPPAIEQTIERDAPDVELPTEQLGPTPVRPAPPEGGGGGR